MHFSLGQSVGVHPIYQLSRKGADEEEDQEKVEMEEEEEKKMEVYDEVEEGKEKWDGCRKGQ